MAEQRVGQRVGQGVGQGSGPGPRWDPTQYLRYADERGRPFVDLVSRIDVEASTVVDLGCGPGQLMGMLRQRWPDADLVGVDSSAEMVERARADDALGATYVHADAAAWRPNAPVDVVVSNAMFQWVPDQLDVLRDLTASVRPGGAVAVQVPDNHDAPSHALLREVAGRAPYAEHAADARGVSATAPEDYLELFAGLGWACDAWATTYLHVLQGEDPVLEWISGTGARPYLQALPDDLRPAFVAAYGAALREAYPRRPFGTVLPFRRTFAVATAPG